MPSGPPEPPERRKLPGTRRTLSAVAISLDPPAVAPPSADARVVASLQRARSFGVTTFDVGSARFPERAEKLVSTAFRSADDEIAVIVARSFESLAESRSPRNEPAASEDVGPALEKSLDESRRRLAPNAFLVVEWAPEIDPDREASGEPQLLPKFARPASDVVWAERLSRPSVSVPSEGRPSTLFSGELSLLALELLPLFGRADSPGDASLIARDVFAGGLLDGSRFAAGAGPGDPRLPPPDVRRLQEEFGPVVRLGFLTAGRRRTLAQAALRFALAWPWVTTAVIPLPAPEHLESVLSFASTPELTETELARLGLVK